MKVIFTLVLFCSVCHAQIAIPPVEFQSIMFDTRPSRQFDHYLYVPSAVESPYQLDAVRSFRIRILNPLDASGAFRITDFRLMAQSAPVALCQRTPFTEAGGDPAWLQCIRRDLPEEFDLLAESIPVASETIFTGGEIRGNLDLDPNYFWHLQGIGTTATGDEIRTEAVWLVPEPSSLLLMALALLQIGFRHKVARRLH